jgi:hypothetical protein
MDWSKLRLSGWWIALCVAVGLPMLASAASSRSGLYNNRHNEAGAIVEHDRAWLQRFRNAEASRLGVFIVIRSYGGSCITGESEWETQLLSPAA